MNPHPYTTRVMMHAGACIAQAASGFLAYPLADCNNKGTTRRQ